MGRWAWLDIHPKNPHVPRRMKKNVRLMADSIEKKTVFNIDIHDIGSVEIKRYHNDILLSLLLSLLSILITNHYCIFCGMQQQLSS